MSDFPPVPLTLEGSSVLHQLFGFDWKAWRSLRGRRTQLEILIETVETLKKVEHGENNAPFHTALYSLLGHKGDLMLIHFRDSLEALNQVELALAQTPLYDFLELRHSYVSVVELGLYESTRKTYESRRGQAGFEPHSPRVETPRLPLLLPGLPTLCPPASFLLRFPTPNISAFIPWTRKRGEHVNWYTVPFAERQRMMHEHGLIGRRYGDQVKQIISGSIGMDDWEWGVDLFADDPVVFKKLIYEMRFLTK